MSQQQQRRGTVPPSFFNPDTAGDPLSADSGDYLELPNMPTEPPAPEPYKGNWLGRSLDSLDAIAADDDEANVLK